MDVNVHWTKRLFIGLSVINVLVLLFVVLISILHISTTNCLTVDQEIRYFGNKTDDTLGRNVEVPDTNTSLCELLSQFEIIHSYIVISICKYQGAVRIDVRHFYGSEPSIKGLWFTVKEWKSMLKILFEINEEIVMQELK